MSCQSSFAVVWFTLVLLVWGLPAQTTSRRSHVVEVVERVGPSIVNISTSSLVRNLYPEFDEFFGPPDQRYKTQSLGSGMIVGEEGFILTNYHVIRPITQYPDSKITATLYNKRNYEAALIAADAQNDLALLKIETSDRLTPVAWGNSAEILIGETAIALGNPFGLQNSVTTGVVSATNRTIAFDGKVSFHDFIQTDAAINPGNSGGALINVDGEVIGVNTAIFSKGQGLGFAIPARRARKTIGQLLDYRKAKGIWLGLELEETDRDSLDWTVQVVYVTPDSPAAKAGISPGDTITEVDGSPVKCLFDLKRKIYAKKNSETVLLQLISAKGVRHVQIKISPLPLQFQYHLLWTKLGIVAAGQTEGVVVKEVKPDSSADRIGMRKGDIVIAMAGYPIQSVEAMNEVARQLEKGMTVSVMLIRSGKRLEGRLVVE